MNSNSLLHSSSFYLCYMLVLTAIAYLSVIPEFIRNRKHGLGLLGLGILTFAMAMFPIQCGDFFYYCIDLHSDTGRKHFEDFYVTLWEWCQNYIEWRAVVWGCSTLLLLLSIKRLRVNKYFASFIVVITQFYYFGTMRNMFGFMLMFYSLILILTCRNRNNNTTLSLIIGCLGLFYCQFLHKSMFMYLILLAPAIIPFGKKIMSISLLAFPFLYGLIFIAANMFLSYAGANDEIISTAEQYTSGTVHVTFMQNVNSIIKYVSYVYLLYIIVKHSNENTPVIFKVLTRYAYMLIYIGSLFWGQATGGWLFLRFTEAGYVALMFVMMYFFYLYPRTIGVKLAFSGLIYFTIYNVLYILYFSEGFTSKLETLRF